MSARESKDTYLKDEDQVKAGLFRWRLWQFKLGGKDGKFVECLGINIDAVNKFLFDKGVRHNNYRTYYLIQAGVVSEIGFGNCVEMVIQEAKALPKGLHIVRSDATVVGSTRDQIINYTIETTRSRMSTAFSPAQWNPDGASWLRDTKEFCYLYFRNGIFRVSKQGVKRFEYGEVDGLIWRRQIIDREFRPTKRKSIIRKFFDLAIGKQYWSEVRSAVGFMVHDHIAEDGCPILLCIERELNELNEGGNGKDFFGQIIGAVRKRSVIDGKHMTDNNRFMFEAIDRDTQIVWFRDIKKSFKMEHMYNFTEGDGISVRRMNTQPFRVKTKVGISLQHSIDIEGRSDERRQLFLLFTKTIGDMGGVGKALRSGVLLGKDWEGDWDAFYSLIVECVQWYLKKGLVKMDIASLREYRIEELTANYDFSQLRLGEEYTYTDAIIKCVGEWAETGREQSAYFKINLHKWAKNMGYFIERGVKKRQRVFKIKISKMGISK